MRVNDSNLNPVTTGAHEAAQTSAIGGGRGASRAAKNAAGGDQVQLSLGAQLHELALNSPERESRIQSLAAAYASGSYQADSGAVSQRLVNDAFGPR